ncbi:MAG: hydrogenase formation protein HypD [Oligoflexales bacterium]|nr:hydrogenase formation protein HypD [Oligoflexales bacterium]
MKYLSEFRDPAAVAFLLQQLKAKITKPLRIMEVCGGQTRSIVKNGLLDLLQGCIEFVHGPGCPVCVTPQLAIDQAIDLSLQHAAIICSYGDMVRVPGTRSSLFEAKSKGASIEVIYSPLEAVEIAKKNPQRLVVLFAIGFETTAPSNAMAIKQAAIAELKNFKTLIAHIRLLPVLEQLFENYPLNIDALLAAGHVCSITGYEDYDAFAKKLGIPIIIAGFEPVDILLALIKAQELIENKKIQASNEYRRVVELAGNGLAQEIMHEVFMPCDAEWRGFGLIPRSGLRLTEKYKCFEIDQDLLLPQTTQNLLATKCQANLVLTGQIKPAQCPEFNKNCRPENPLGAPMVSSEGACAAYFSA